MKNNLLNSLIKTDCSYTEGGKVIHFILSDEERPMWSKLLNRSYVEKNEQLNMNEHYELQNNIMLANEKLKKFVDFVGSEEGIKMDLASGPSGYFAPILQTLKSTDAFVAMDACPIVIEAHANACNLKNFYVFDIDLDKPLPFHDDAVNVFSGNWITNVDSLPMLLKEVYRCLRHGGKFAVIEMFYENGSVSSEYLKSLGNISASFETFVSYCENVGFTFIDSDIIQTRKGKISEGDAFPLDDNDCSVERTIYFEKI